MHIVEGESLMAALLVDVISGHDFRSRRPRMSCRPDRRSVSSTRTPPSWVSPGPASTASIRIDVVGDGLDVVLVEVITDSRGSEEAKRQGLGLWPAVTST